MWYFFYSSCIHTGGGKRIYHSCLNEIITQMTNGNESPNAPRRQRSPSRERSRDRRRQRPPSRDRSRSRNRERSPSRDGSRGRSRQRSESRQRSNSRPRNGQPARITRAEWEMIIDYRRHQRTPSPVAQPPAIPDSPSYSPSSPEAPPEAPEEPSYSPSTLSTPPLRSRSRSASQSPKAAIPTSPWSTGSLPDSPPQIAQPQFRQMVAHGVALLIERGEQWTQTTSSSPPRTSRGAWIKMQDAARRPASPNGREIVPMC